MGIHLKVSGILMMIFVLIYPAFAQKGIGDSRDIAREHNQPEIETIEGNFDHIKTGPCEHTTGYAYIGTHLFIKTGQENDQLLNVHLGAAFAVESFVNGLETGQDIVVEVFRTDQMEPSEFVARKITANGHELELRDEILRPFWPGDRNFQRGRHSGRHGCRW